MKPQECYWSGKIPPPTLLLSSKRVKLFGSSLNFTAGLKIRLALPSGNILKHPNFVKVHWFIL